MIRFSLYNYMFEKCAEDDFFYDEERQQEVERNFIHRQKCFDDVFIDDFNNEKRINFTNARGTQYLHRFLLAPYREEGVYILMILNNCRGTRHDEQLNSIPFDDYRRCIIIIDNRPGVQLLAIENSTTAFRTMKSVKNILEKTFSRIMAQRFSLKVSIRNIYNSSCFWEIVNDRNRYPRGFRKVEFTWPKPNLERLAKRFEFIQGIRKDTNAGVKLVTDAGAGNAVHLNAKDKWTRDVVEVASDIGGDASISLTPNGSRKKINVGKDNYRYINFEDATFSNMSLDNPELYPKEHLKALINKIEKDLQEYGDSDRL